MHGDFTPWNLRDIGEPVPVLMDWEAITWAPPLADALWYDSVIEVSGLSIARSGITPSDETIRYWIDRLSNQVSPGETTIASSVLDLVRERAMDRGALATDG